MDGEGEGRGGCGGGQEGQHNGSSSGEHLNPQMWVVQRWMGVELSEERDGSSSIDLTSEQ